MDRISSSSRVRNCGAMPTVPQIPPPRARVSTAEHGGTLQVAAERHGPRLGPAAQHASSVNKVGNAFSEEGRRRVGGGSEHSTELATKKGGSCRPATRRPHEASAYLRDM
eukprot:1188800-Prorocentrum_minimum.AAC.4